MSEILDNIYDRSAAILFGTSLYLELCFLALFGDCGNLFFDEKFFKILY